MWQDKRGAAGKATHDIAHRDDAKDRRDETHSRGDHRIVEGAGGKLPAWTVPVGAAVAVLLVGRDLCGDA